MQELQYRCAPVSIHANKHIIILFKGFNSKGSEDFVEHILRHRDALSHRLHNFMGLFVDATQNVIHREANEAFLHVVDGV